MRAHLRIPLLIAVSLWPTVAFAQPCEAVATFIERLEAGQTPTGPLDLEGCEVNVEAELAKALATFAAQKPDDVPTVVVMLREAHRKADAQKLEAARRELHLTHQSLTKSVSDMQMLFPWIIAVLVLGAAASVAAGVQAVRRPAGGRRAAQEAALNAEAVKRLAQMQTTAEDIDKTVRKLEESAGATAATRQELQQTIKSWAERMPEGRVLGETDLAAVTAKLDALRAEVEERLSTAGARPTAVALERDVLAVLWNDFQTKAPGSWTDGDEAWPQIREQALFRLRTYVQEDLRPTLESVLTPAREYDALICKIAAIPRILAGDVKARETEALEITRLRELAHILVMTQSSNLLAERLAFRAKPWIAETFVGFADLYLQRYQEARRDGAHAPFEGGIEIVRNVLRVAGIEPIELSLGQTLFDSAQHIGRSTTNDPRFPDGAIVDVVRNGFVQGGHEVIRQPEVIVNRMR